MGLDSVEFVMTLEDAFYLAILDEDVERLFTVGDAFEYLVMRLQCHAPAPACPSAHRFYRLREELTVRFHVSRSRVRLDARIAELVPTDSHRSRWPDVTAAVGLAPPRVRLGWFSWPTRFPEPSVTVRELVGESPLDEFFDSDGGVDREVVWRKLVTIVAEQFCVPPQRIRPQTSFVKDLGMD
jgi:acyl carrier protein